MSLRQGNWNLNKKTMKGEVKSVLASGTFQDMYVWEVEVLHEDGSSNVYKKYTKKDNAFVSTGDVITFEVNEKGSMKNVEKASGSQGANEANKTDKPFIPAINPEKQQSIERQKCLDEAGKYFERFPPEKMKLEYQLTVADMMYYWVTTGKIPTEQPTLSGGHPQEVDDLPF